MATALNSTAPRRRAHAGQVTPFARALALLGAFTPQERWLALRDLADRTGLATSTASRLARALAACGYLHHDTEGRRFRLTASVMSLGYGAAANSGARKAARLPMAAFARQNGVHMILCGRERLELIVLDTCDAPPCPQPLRLHVGVRVGMSASPMGWALMAALPEVERHYLEESMERRLPREWAQQRRRMGEAIAQVRERGWCSAAAPDGEPVTVVAAPVRVADQSPLVLACIGASADMTRARIERELGPRLAGTAASLLDPGAP